MSEERKELAARKIHLKQTIADKERLIESLTASGQTAQYEQDRELFTGLLAKTRVELKDAQQELAEVEKAIDKLSARPKQAERLIGYVLDSDVELFHDHNNRYGRFCLDGHLETWRLSDPRFDEWLSHLMYVEEGKAPYGEAISQAKNILGYLAGFEGKEHPLYNRVGEQDGAIWYDLADRGWRAVRIDENGWEIVERPPILFRRYAHQETQVEPEPVENPASELTKLFDFVHLEGNEQRTLLLAYVISAYVPNFPHAILTFHGEKRSGKTISFQVLQNLIDPSSANLLYPSRDERDFVQLLSHHWACYFDNVTTLTDWQQDTLCRACTGAGVERRRLYTNDGAWLAAFKRCVGSNGINIISTRSDLLDRSLLFELQHINEGKSERKLWQEFEKARPRLLGAIFGTLSQALPRFEEGLALAGVFRLADFAAWGFAITEALGDDGNRFFDILYRHVKDKAAMALDFHPFGVAIQKLMGETEEWEGTAGDLLKRLGAVADQEGIDTDARLWPGSPSWVGRRLQEVKTDLREIGIVVERPTRTEKGRRIRIHRV